MYDLIVIGGGPAGLTAGLYGGRARLSTLVLEQGAPGGQVMTTDVLANYPGFPDGVEGPDLGLRLEQQVRNFDVEVRLGPVEKVDLTGEVKRVWTIDGEETAKTMVLATGANPKLLGVPGEDRLRGRGVSYCATCDGAFYRNKKVAVVGGGDSALTEALFLTRFAEKVYIVHRRSELRAVKILVEQAEANPKIEFVLESHVDEIAGAERVEALRFHRGRQAEELPVNGVFVYVGLTPNTELFQGQVHLDENGYIVAGESTKTNVPGVYAAGDVRRKWLRQVVTAVADGAVAAMMAEHFITHGHAPD